MYDTHYEYEYKYSCGGKIITNMIGPHETIAASAERVGERYSNKRTIPNNRSMLVVLVMNAAYRILLESKRGMQFKTSLDRLDFFSLQSWVYPPKKKKKMAQSSRSSGQNRNFWKNSLHLKH